MSQMHTADATCVRLGTWRWRLQLLTGHCSTHHSCPPRVEGQVPLRMVHPFAFMWKAFATCCSFALLMNTCLARTPCTPETPWSLVFYSDEVTPGDALVHDNRRKLQVVYFSFLEFGPSVLAREDSWFTIAAKRSSEVCKISGGMSAVFAAALLLFFGAAST